MVCHSYLHLLILLADAMFLRGLREGGIPIKFSSWHTFIYATGSAANVNLLIQERSRSVKALFTVQRRSPVVSTTDSGACFYDTAAASTLQSYQYRIGGRYFPASPVQCSIVLGGAISNGAAEAYVELEKALNIVGDYRLSTGVNSTRWGVPLAAAALTIGVQASAHSEWDYAAAITTVLLGAPFWFKVEQPGVTTVGNGFCANVGSACYSSAVSLETSNGLEISGLNAEEQSDISFSCNWAVAQAAFALEVYSYYDAMMVLKENNVVELIQ